MSLMTHIKTVIKFFIGSPKNGGGTECEIAQGKKNDEVSKTQDAEGVRKIAGVIVKDALRDETGEIRPRVLVPESLQRRVVEIMFHRFLDDLSHSSEPMINLNFS